MGAHASASTAGTQRRRSGCPAGRGSSSDPAMRPDPRSRPRAAVQSAAHHPVGDCLPMRSLKGVAALAFVAVLAAACTGSSSSPSAAASAGASAPAESVAASVAPSQPAAACTFDSLQTKTPGTLTIGADNPAYPPYYQPSDPATDPWELGDPTNRLGFEGRVAWSIARNLGFVGDTVTWVVAPFNNAIGPGEKDFDIYLTQVS